MQKVRLSKSHTKHSCTFFRAPVCYASNKAQFNFFMAMREYSTSTDARNPAMFRAFAKWRQLRQDFLADVSLKYNAISWTVKRPCMISVFALGIRKPKLASSGRAMSWLLLVLFYVSMEIPLWKFSSGNCGHTSWKKIPVGNGLRVATVCD